VNTNDRWENDSQKVYDLEFWVKEMYIMIEKNRHWNFQKAKRGRSE